MPKFRCKERLIKMPLPIQLVTPKDITQTKKNTKAGEKNRNVAVVNLIQIVITAILLKQIHGHLC